MITSPYIMSGIGFISLIFIASLFSSNYQAINLRRVLVALILQVTSAIFMLKTNLGATFFASLAYFFTSLYQFADNGASFVFGKLTDASAAWGMIFAFKVVPIIIFFGALMAVLSYLGIVHFFVRGVCFVLRPLLGTSGAETLSAVASSMLGQTEAPLLIKDYLACMTRSELLTIMVSGMSHLSGAILAVYGSMGVSIELLLASSVMSVFGSIAISKLLLPEEGQPETMNDIAPQQTGAPKSLFEALAIGTGDGLSLALNVVAMLIAFISLIACVNGLLVASTSYTIQDVLGYVFYAVAYLIGIVPEECRIAGQLVGTKLLVNEFVAYSDMVKIALTPRTYAMLTFALAGFSNFSCIGIQIGGIGALSPARRGDLSQLGLKALLGGTIVNLMNAALVGMLL